MKRQILALTLALTIISPTLAMANEIDEVQAQIMTNESLEALLSDEQKQLVTEQTTLKEELYSLVAEKDSVQENVQLIIESLAEKNRAILKKEFEIKVLEEKIEGTITSIAEKGALIEIKIAEEKDKQKLLADRLRQNYKSGFGVNGAEVLFKSANLRDFITKWKALRNIIKFDKQTIKEIEDIRKNLEKTKKKLQSDQKKLEDLKVSLQEEEARLAAEQRSLEIEKIVLEERLAELEALSEVKSEKQAELESKIAEVNDSLGTLRFGISELDNKLNALLAEEQRKEEEIKLALEQKEEQAQVAENVDLIVEQVAAEVGNDTFEEVEIEEVVVYTKPVETTPAYTKPVETKPVYTQPVETKPVYTKPASQDFISPTSGIVTSWYGYRTDPVYGGTAFHGGIDIANNYNTPLYAAKSGVVIAAGYNGSYGNCVDIEHPDGYVTRYAHMNSIIAYVGQEVEQGEKIGLMGSTGKSTGSHVHFEIRVGDRNSSYTIDPASYIGY